MAVGWGGETDGDALTLTSSWQYLESGGGGVDIEVQMDPNQHMHGWLSYNPQATPTDKCQFRVLGSTDGTNYSTEPVLAFGIDNTNDPGSKDFLISGYYSLMFQARLSGSTDTTSTATLSWRVATLS